MRNIVQKLAWLFVTAWDFLSWFGAKARAIYLTIVTFGAWSRLGNFTFDLHDKISILEHRVNKFMRYWEEMTGAPLPADFEPPRLTAHGEGIDIWQEADLVRRELERLKKEPEVTGRPPEGTVSPRPDPSPSSLIEAEAHAAEAARQKSIAEALGLVMDPPKPSQPLGQAKGFLP